MPRSKGNSAESWMQAVQHRRSGGKLLSIAIQIVIWSKSQITDERYPRRIAPSEQRGKPEHINEILTIVNNIVAYPPLRVMSHKRTSGSPQLCFNSDLPVIRSEARDSH